MKAESDIRELITYFKLCHAEMDHMEDSTRSYELKISWLLSAYRYDCYVEILQHLFNENEYGEDFIPAFVAWRRNK